MDPVSVVPVWKSEIPPLCKDSGGCDLLLPEVWFQHHILPACSKSQGQAWTMSKASSARYPVQLYFLHLTPFVPPCFLRVFPAHSSAFSHPHIPCFIAELELSSQPDPPRKHLPCHTRNYCSLTCGGPRTCCALWGRRIMMMITPKFPMIRNGPSSRSYLVTFPSVGAAWGGHKQLSPRCPTGVVAQSAGQQQVRRTAFQG